MQLSISPTDQDRTLRYLFRPSSLIQSPQVGDTGLWHLIDSLPAGGTDELESVSDLVR